MNHPFELRVCARALREHREAVVQALIQGTGYGRENRFQDVPNQLRERVGESLALLIEHLEGREDFGSLYTGQRLFELTRLEKTHQANLEEYRRAVGEDEDVYLTLLGPYVSARALQAFKTAFRLITAGLVAEALAM